ncbi:MAG: hypothetical protein L6Q29_02080 [Candidatus Pacebacteria bacterium]|nr:hypothetical protein [Candidatus Paceibacterota bacterium]
MKNKFGWIALFCNILMMLLIGSLSLLNSFLDFLGLEGWIVLFFFYLISVYLLPIIAIPMLILSFKNKESFLLRKLNAVFLVVALVMASTLLRVIFGWHYFILF